MEALLVAVGGALGALARFGIGRGAGDPDFPWPTVVINIAGSFLLGLLLTAMAAQKLRPEVATGLGVGFLGGFTTFSTLTWDSFALLRANRPVAAGLNVIASVVIGVAAAAAGYLVAQQTLR